MGNHISSLQSGPAIGPDTAVSRERRECFLADSVPPGFHDFTADLGLLGIRLPRGQHLVVQQASETLIHLQQALGCLNDFAHAAATAERAPQIRDNALQAGALLLRLGALNHLFPHDPVESGDTVRLPVAEAIPQWVCDLLQSPARARQQHPAESPRLLQHSPLHRAALGGDLEGLHTLLRAGVAVDCPDTHGRTALHAAALKNHLPVINALLRAGATVDATDNTGCTPLVVAVQADSLKAMNALLRARATVDVITAEGLTPLTIATALGKVQAMQSLLAAGAKPDFAGSAGRPLHYAVLCGESAGVEQLLRAGADATAPSDWRLYCGEGAPAPQHAPQPVTPLELAAMIGSVKIVRALQEHGADVLAAGPAGVPLIIRAASAGQINVLNHLLRAGAKPNDTDPLGRGPLSWAAENGHLAVFKRLLSQGAKPLASDRQGNSVLHWAASNTTEHNRDNKRAMVGLLLKQPGAGVNTRNNRNETPLHRAAMGDDATMVQTLLDSHAKAELKDHQGRTALHCAAALGTPSGVRHLIDAGAHFDEPDQTGDTPLHYASQRGDEAIVWLLVARGADVTVRNRDKRQPGYFAAHGGHIALAEALAGQEVVRQSVGPGVPTPLGRAREIGQGAIKKFMEEHFGASALPGA
jgi:ankyrin repeat protein